MTARCRTVDRLGRDLKHLVTTVRGLADRGVGLSVLTGQGANIDTTTSSGKLIFGIFAALAEFEGDLIRERTMAGLAAARARGRHGGRKFELTKNQVRIAQSAMANRDTHVAQLCEELDISRATLYRYVGVRTAPSESTPSRHWRPESPTGATEILCRVTYLCRD